MTNEIILYETDELPTRIDVRVDNETVWLNRMQIAELFGRDVKTIGKHVNNVFKEGELVKELVVAKFATTTQHGAIKGKTQTSEVEHYNLDVIISVGYRVKSKQGTQFRIWANKILKDYLLRGYALNNRMNRVEDQVEALNGKVSEMGLQINSHLIPTQGVFFDGQTYDAYAFVNRLIAKAQKSIVLIDNYVDDTVITQLTKKQKNVSVHILSKTLSKQLKLDVQKANAQYPGITATAFAKAHDRFLIIDQKEVYHLGASLKDLGKKWFAFSKLETGSVTILQSIKEVI